MRALMDFINIITSLPPPPPPYMGGAMVVRMMITAIMIVYNKILAYLECKNYLHRDISWPQKIAQGKEHCQPHPIQFDLFSCNWLLLTFEHGPQKFSPILNRFEHYCHKQQLTSLGIMTINVGRRASSDP